MGIEKLNGKTKWIIGVVFGMGAFYGVLRMGLREQKTTKNMTVRNDTRLTTLETGFKYFSKAQDEMKADIKILIRRK